MSMEKEIADLQKLQTEKEKEIESLQKLSIAFPDLEKYVGRWGKKAYFSAQVNDKVTHYDLRHNCGCCQDSPLELWPYIETPNGPVYSKPPMFQIGERCYLGGDIATSGWKEKLRQSHIPESIIERLKSYFREEHESRQASVNELDELSPDSEESDL